MRIVVDTNVLIGAIMSAQGANRLVLRRCLCGEDTPLVSQALFSEIREVMSRDDLFAKAPVRASDRQALFEAFCASAQWVRPYVLWRPNLPDEADNHVIELALNGHASVVVSWNARDFRQGELRFPALRVLDPVEYLKLLTQHGG